jgi:hypothetical protein
MFLHILHFQCIAASRDRLRDQWVELVEEAQQEGKSDASGPYLRSAKLKPSQARAKLHCPATSQIANHVRWPEHYPSLVEKKLRRGAGPNSILTLYQIQLLYSV